MLSTHVVPLLLARQALTSTHDYLIAALYRQVGGARILSAVEGMDRFHALIGGYRALDDYLQTLPESFFDTQKLVAQIIDECIDHYRTLNDMIDDELEATGRQLDMEIFPDDTGIRWNHVRVLVQDGLGGLVQDGFVDEDGDFRRHKPVKRYTDFETAHDRTFGAKSGVPIVVSGQYNVPLLEAVVPAAARRYALEK